MNGVCFDDWTAEWAIIAGNVLVWDEKKSKICLCDNHHMPVTATPARLPEDSSIYVI